MPLITMFEQISGLVAQNDKSCVKLAKDFFGIVSFLKNHPTASAEELQEYLRKTKTSSAIVNETYLTARENFLKLNTGQCQEAFQKFKFFLALEHVTEQYQSSKYGHCLKTIANLVPQTRFINFNDIWGTLIFQNENSSPTTLLSSMWNSSPYKLSTTRYAGGYKSFYAKYTVSQANILHMFVLAKEHGFSKTEALRCLLIPINSYEIAKMLQQRATVSTTSPYKVNLTDATPYACLEKRHAGQQLLYVATAKAGLLPLYEYFNNALTLENINQNECNDFCKMLEYLTEKAQDSNSDLSKELNKLTWSSFKEDKSEYFAFRTALLKLDNRALRKAVTEFATFEKSESFKKHYHATVRSWGLIPIYGYLTEKLAKNPSDRETLRKVEDFAEIVAKLRTAATSNSISPQYVKTLIDDKKLRGFISQTYYNLKADLCTFTPAMLRKNLEEFEGFLKRSTASKNSLWEMFNKHYKAAETQVGSSNGAKPLGNTEALQELQKSREFTL